MGYEPEKVEGSNDFFFSLVIASILFLIWVGITNAQLTTTVSVTISDTPQIIKEAEYTAGVGVSAAVNLTTENAETTRLHEQSR